MFCIKCGKKAEIENFCESCFLQENELFEIENFSIGICDCGSYFDKKWVGGKNLETILEGMVEKNIRTENKIISKSISFSERGNKILAWVKLKGFIKPCKKIKIEKKKIEIILKKQKCETCIKLLGGYYEAVLQIRGGNKKKILNKIKKFSGMRVEEVKNGYNVKFIKKNQASKAAKKLRNFEIKKSYQLVGMKKGKEIYRNYYCVR